MYTPSFPDFSSWRYGHVLAAAAAVGDRCSSDVQPDGGWIQGIPGGVYRGVHGYTPTRDPNSGLDAVPRKGLRSGEMSENEKSTKSSATKGGPLFLIPYENGEKPDLVG